MGIDIVTITEGAIQMVGGDAVPVVDNLLSNSATSALSANQGRVLSEMIADIPGGPGGAVDSVNGLTGVVVLTKSSVGLANVDNTSDVNKPVSTAQATAIAAKEPAITAGSTGQYYRGDKTMQSLDKASVGLSNVDNTSDSNKPVSTLQAAAIALKIDTNSKGAVNGVASLDSGGKVPSSQLPSYVDDVSEFADLASFPSIGETGKIYVADDTNLTYRWSGSAYVRIADGDVSSVAGRKGVIVLTSADVGLGNVNNTTDAAKPVSTATATALGLKANISSLSTVATSGAYADLSGRPTLATVATTGVYTDLTSRPTLSTVAGTGAYADLTGKPSIPAAQVNSDWTASGGVSQILNKPTLSTVATSGSYADLTNKPTYTTAATLPGSLTGYVDGSEIVVTT